jgi:hypothetical protein
MAVLHTAEHHIHQAFIPTRCCSLHVGLGLKEDLLRAALDECLVTVEEAEGGGFSALPDPFEPWPDVTDLMDMGE